MQIGLSYDLKEIASIDTAGPEDAFEEYDSTETVESIAASLESCGHSVIMLGGGKQFLTNILREKVDFIFNIAEGRGTHRSREAQVPSVLEMLNIPYSGSEPQCLTICLDKPLAKKLVATVGVCTPRWQVIRDKEDLSQSLWDKFPFPGIAKPAYEGSSKGIRLTSLVGNAREATELVSELLDCYRQPVIVEEFITGDEVTVGMIGNSPPQVLGLMRILPRTNEPHFLYSLEVKRNWKTLVDYECPALLAENVVERIRASSLKAFEVLGCRDFARLDFKVSAQGIPYFLEINPLPGLSTQSDLVIIAIKQGWTYQTLIGAILDAALKRYPHVSARSHCLQ